ncbi:MAG: hypothetical protein OXT64_02305 [Gammaproteobacteria bacterium]|nr:hypothetical protein [Gammaproteobacteria bacterium]MDE0239368.1 hypothetical protein [bacterium]
MKNEGTGKRFDSVAYMREARERISAEISGMSHEEFRQWVNGYRQSNPALARLAGRRAESIQGDAD